MNDDDPPTEDELEIEELPRRSPCTLDWEYMERWADELGVREGLQRLRRDPTTG